MQMLRTEPSIAESAAPLVVPLIAILNEGVVKVAARSDAVSALCCLSILAAQSPAVNEQCRQQKACAPYSLPRPISTHHFGSGQSPRMGN